MTDLRTKYSSGHSLRRPFNGPSQSFKGSSETCSQSPTPQSHHILESKAVFRIYPLSKARLPVLLRKQELSSAVIAGTRHASMPTTCYIDLYQP